MKKTKILSLVLALTLGVTAFAGCGDTNGDVGADLPINSGKVDSTHQTIATETDKYMVKNGKTEYQILLSETPSQQEQLAASELVALFEESTGCKLAVVSGQNSVTEGGKYISVGRTELFQKTGIKAVKTDLENDGFVIKSQGDAVYVCGGGEMGTLYGVYELMTYLFGFETYAADCYSLNTVSDVKFYEFDVVEKPDFAKRLEGYKFVRDNPTYMNRLRQSSYTQSFIFVNGKEVHNSLSYLPPEKYAEAHDSWYAPQNVQLCYTAHGSETEYRAMVSEAAKVMEEHLIANPDLDTITFTQQDTPSWCNCTFCGEENAKYGTDSAAVIKFCNAVNAEVRAWMQGEGKDYARDLSILFFAYQTTVAAPVKKTDKGYEPIDDSVKCDDGVCVFYAPIEMDYTVSVQDEINTLYKDNFEQWAAISDRVYLWLYSTNFHHYLLPYDNFGTMQELYTFVKGTNAYMLYDQSQTDQGGGATAFTVLKSYLAAKFEWNVQYDQQTLTDNFFANYYGAAAPSMRTYYNELLVHIASLKARGLYGGRSSIYQQVNVPELWEYSLLKRWNGYIDEALAAIADLQTTDADTYAVLYKHIVQERVFLDYMLISIYDYKHSETDVAAMKAQFISDVNLVGMTRLKENGDITTLLNEYAK